MTASVEGHLSKLYAIGNIQLLIFPAHSVKELCSVEDSQRRGLMNPLLVRDSPED